MASITFDTHKIITQLKKAGIPEAQAEAITSAFQDVTSDAEVASKRDIADVRRDIRESELRLGGEINLLKWMMTFLLGGMVAMLFKLFA
jgi:hypothetical protein